MAADEIESVLRDWIEQALSPIGQLPSGVSPAGWIAARFSAWWHDRAGDTIAEAERAARGIRDELMRLGGWEQFGESLHEMIHLQDALTELRGLMRTAFESDS